MALYHSLRIPIELHLRSGAGHSELYTRWRSHEPERRCNSSSILSEWFMERVRGIEPPLRAWEARVLPLNYTRMSSANLRRLPSMSFLFNLKNLLTLKSSTVNDAIVAPYARAFLTVFASVLFVFAI